MLCEKTGINVEDIIGGLDKRIGSRFLRAYAYGGSCFKRHKGNNINSR